MTRDELNQLNALVYENDMITAALANLQNGGLVFSAAIGPSADYSAGTPPMMPPVPVGMMAPVNVPLVDVPASLVTEITNYLTARQTTVQGDLATRGATADPAKAPSNLAPPPPPQMSPAPRGAAPAAPLPRAPQVPPAVRR